MKIGIDARTLMDKNYSGISECTYNLIKAITKINGEAKQHQIKLFYNFGVNIKKNLPQFEDIEQIYTRYPNKFFNYILQKILNFPKLDRLLKVDLFFMPHFNFASIFKAKKVLIVHDLSFLKYPSFFDKRKNFWHKMLNVKKIIRESDKIIAISKNTKRDIINIVNIDSKKIKVIHNGINNEFKVLNTNNEKLKKIKRKYNLTNIQLVIVGQVGWSSKNITKTANKLKNKIKFLGYIPQDEKIYLYNLASVFVFPSFYEGFGLPPLEAMACGTPVITSNTSSLPEIVENNAITIDPYNKQDIIMALDVLYSNEQIKNLLSQKGIEQTREFNWHEIAKKYLKVIQEFQTI